VKENGIFKYLQSCLDETNCSCQICVVIVNIYSELISCIIQVIVPTSGDHMQTKLINRRTLLKGIVAGAGGIAASSFLPEKWVKPVISSGVLPVHAQASGGALGTISGRLFERGTIDPPPYSYDGWGGLPISVDGYPSLTDTTDDNGNFTINNVPLGSQTIRVDPTGWSILWGDLDTANGDTAEIFQTITVVPGVNPLNFYYPIS
jgi:hypothetical protein